MIKKTRPALVLVTILFAVMFASTGIAYAASEESESPIREVHKVGVGDKAYCFFVTKNVVMTPAEIGGMTDAELTEEVLSRSGLYMKEANCRIDSHKAISAADWTRSKGRFLLSSDDIDALRAAALEDGVPEKMYMDLRVSTKLPSEDPEDEDPGEVYSTYKKVSPKLIFVAVATEADAASGEDICEAPETKPGKQKKMSMPSMKGGSGPEDMLPEYRTIRMSDRSGAPVRDTLEDGTPVTLEWIDPKKDPSGDAERSFIDHIPGRYAGLALMPAAAAGIMVFAIARRKRDDEN